MVFISRKAPSPAVVAADAVAITHFLVGIAALLIGEFTNLFSSMRSAHAGMDFIFKYLDAPVFYGLRRAFVWLGNKVPILEPYISWLGEYHGTAFNLISTTFVIVAASIFYGLIVFFVLKIISFMFK